MFQKRIIYGEESVLVVSVSYNIVTVPFKYLHFIVRVNTSVS